jgi:hypothetical protein
MPDAKTDSINVAPFSPIGLRRIGRRGTQGVNSSKDCAGRYNFYNAILALVR